MRPLVAWSLNKVCGVWDLWLSSGGGTWVRQIKGRVGSPDGRRLLQHVWQAAHRTARGQRGVTVGRCRKKQQESQESEANLDLDMRRLRDSDLQLQILYLQLHRKLATNDWWGFPQTKGVKGTQVHLEIRLHKCAAQY